jgi:transcriptional regulator EpsA
MDLNPSELEYVALNMDEATRVRRRSQFVLWVQGSLQALVPHRVLAIALASDSGRDDAIEFEAFSREPVTPALVEQIGHGPQSLLRVAMQRWRGRGGDVWFCASDPFDVEFEWAGRAMSKAGVDLMVGHGVRDVRGQISSFYLFLGDAKVDRKRYGYCVELLLPQLHAAFCRVAANDIPDALGRAPFERVLTDREVEVLRWVQRGKSNSAIAAVLEISPLTVKNHLQKILKKLNAENRAQAVSQGIARKIIAFEPYR